MVSPVCARARSVRLLHAFTSMVREVASAMTSTTRQEMVSLSSIGLGTNHEEDRCAERANDTGPDISGGARDTGVGQAPGCQVLQAYREAARRDGGSWGVGS